MVSQLGVDELLHVFSFLEARDLLQAAQVNTVWNEVSKTKELWRQLCLRRWSSCRASQMVPGTQTWKQYYLSRSELEFRVESGRPEDFVCKAIAGHTGQIDQLAYVSTNEYRFDGREKSVVCTVSADCTVRAWDLHEVVCAEGNLRTLMVPQLKVVSKVTTFPHASLGFSGSPDGQWVYVFPQHLDLGPQVFYIQSLLDPLEDEPPVSTILPVNLASRACWAPGEAARLIVMHRNSDCTQMIVTTFELKAEKCRGRTNTLVQQMVSFPLPDTLMPPHLMQSHSSQVILLACGSKLVLFTIYGRHLTTFQDHQRSITSLWVDANRVITSSLDLSLRIYMWNKENKIPALKSCYHLLGGSHRWASGFIHVKSDSTSIVAVEARSIGTSILRSYCFKVRHN
ncbi:cyclin-dependent kinase 20 isoform X2 [Perognathus longimembris pacificus]|uniref:cyclin-dependent kinase 20 isoform X2 n=1 Tax=Perognathus longimembris pacificus TaxID=214514 RepID=UPI0020191831|nr:cyclin-dependent kinase 20 isoform X2 [Perognathus longimembris pacificus]